MKDVDQNDSAVLRELLTKNWITHDGMWFFHCLQECGIETTNRINKAAVRSMASLECGRILKFLGIKGISSFIDLKDFLGRGQQLYKPDFMKFRITFPEENLVRWEFEKDSCFAWSGIKKMGYLDEYQCAVFDRPMAWFDSLGLKYSVTPRVEKCLMHTDGYCLREFSFTFG